MSWAEIEEIIGLVSDLCEVVPLTPELQASTRAIAARASYTIYDAQIIAADADAGCPIVWSEEMQDGYRLPVGQSELEIRNLFSGGDHVSRPDPSKERRSFRASRSIAQSGLWRPRSPQRTGRSRTLFGSGHHNLAGSAIRGRPSSHAVGRRRPGAAPGEGRANRLVYERPARASGRLDRRSPWSVWLDLAPGINCEAPFP